MQQQPLETTQRRARRRWTIIGALVAVAVAAFVMLRFWGPCDPPSKPVPAATGDDAGSTSGTTVGTDAGGPESTGEVQTVVPDDLGTSTTAAAAVTGA